MARDLCLQKDLSQALNLLSDVHDGKGPESKVVEQLTDFNKKVMKHIENDLKVVWDENDGEFVEGFGPGKTLNGLEAMSALLVKMNRTTSGQCPNELNMLRSWRWLLSPKEDKLLEAWTRESVANERDRLKTIKAKAIKDIEGQQAKP